MILLVPLGSVFLSGFLSFLSPCVLPLVLPYLCYISGVTIEDLQREDHKGRGLFRLFLSSVLFVLGFSTIFVILGATASALGEFLSFYHSIFTRLAGIFIALMGLNFLGVVRVSFLLKEFRVQAKGVAPNALGAYVMGAAFAFGWTPCIGPVLASILAIAGTEATVWRGALLLMFYALGLGIPFLLAALFSKFFIQFLNIFRVHLGKVEKIMGLLLLLIGVLFVFFADRTENISYWFIDHFSFLNTYD